MAEHPLQQHTDAATNDPTGKQPVAPAAPAVGTSAPPKSPSASGPPTDDELKQAMSAFRKRLKLTILDQESKLGGGRPVTSGKKSRIAGIMPPNQFRREIWKELAARKQIKDMGGGFYSLP